MNGATLLLIGEIVIASAVGGMIIDFLVFRSNRKKLNGLLEQKYGPKRH